MFVDQSVGVTYRGPDEVAKPVENYGTAFSDSCDVFKLKNGRIQVFDCYPSGTVILGQLGVLGDLDAVLEQHAAV